MIKEHGTVSVGGIKEKDILITNFVFEGVNLAVARREALEWASQTILATLRTLSEKEGGRNKSNLDTKL